MTSTNDIGELEAELTRLLDGWGGTPARWPPHVRRRVEEIAAAVPSAQRLLAEAGALDRVIGAAGDASARAPDRLRSLSDRIVAAAIADAAAAPTSAPLAKPTDNVVMLQPRPRIAPVPRQREQWRAAALMAASLFLGIYIGGTVNLAPALQDFADAVGLSTEFEPATIASIDDANDEDAL